MLSLKAMLLDLFFSLIQTIPKELYLILDARSKWIYRSQNWTSFEAYSGQLPKVPNWIELFSNMPRMILEAGQNKNHKMGRYFPLKFPEKERAPHIGSPFSIYSFFYSIVGLNAPPQSLFCRTLGFLSIIDCWIGKK